MTCGVRENATGVLTATGTLRLTHRAVTELPEVVQAPAVRGTIGIGQTAGVTVTR